MKTSTSNDIKNSMEYYRHKLSQHKFSLMNFNIEKLPESNPQSKLENLKSLISKLNPTFVVLTETNQHALKDSKLDLFIDGYGNPHLSVNHNNKENGYGVIMYIKKSIGDCEDHPDPNPNCTYFTISKECNLKDFVTADHKIKKVSVESTKKSLYLVGTYRHQTIKNINQKSVDMNSDSHKEQFITHLREVVYSFEKQCNFLIAGDMNIHYCPGVILGGMSNINKFYRKELLHYMADYGKVQQHVKHPTNEKETNIIDHVISNFDMKTIVIDRTVMLDEFNQQKLSDHNIVVGYWNEMGELNGSTSSKRLQKRKFYAKLKKNTNKQGKKSSNNNRKKQTL